VTRAARAAPKSDRPRLPPGYLSAKGRAGMVAWQRAEELLERAQGFWLATTNADGRPHLVQQWGAWVDAQLYFEGSPDTRWARNLARDPRCAVSVEHGSEVVILEGTVERGHRPPRPVAEAIAKTYGRKYGRVYGYRPKPEQYDEGLHLFRPTVGFAWDVRTFGKSLTRFAF
jgi:hypothetical protein